MEFPVLHSTRLLLRAMEPRDAPGYAELLSDPSSYPYISDSGPVAAADVPARVVRNQRAFDSGSHLYWSIEYASSASFVGYVTLHQFSSPAPALSYAIRASWRRRRIASEAIQLVEQYALSELHVPQLVARTHPENLASSRLLQSLDFLESGLIKTREGTRLEFVKSAA